MPLNVKIYERNTMYTSHLTNLYIPIILIQSKFVGRWVSILDKIVKFGQNCEFELETRFNNLQVGQISLSPCRLPNQVNTNISLLSGISQSEICHWILMVQDHLMIISITVSMKLKNRIVSRGICYYITANGRHTFHVSYIIAQLTRECHRVGVDLFVYNCYTT